VKPRCLRRLPFAAFVLISITLLDGAVAGRRHALASAPAHQQSGAPPVGLWRPYSVTSAWNRRIGTHPSIHPNSHRMVATLVQAGRSRGFVVAHSHWSVPVFYVNQETPRRSIALLDKWRPADRLLGVPIPERAFSDRELDGHMAIVDLDAGCEWDFYGARRTGNGSWKAVWANRIEVNGDGVFDEGAGARASSFALMAGLLRPQHFNAARIEHALVFGYPFTARGNVWPATTNDGKSSTAGYIPEGARLQLAPDLDLRTFQLDRWQKVVARALQTYGMYLADTSGGPVSLFAQHPRSDVGGVAYPWGNVDYPTLPVSLLRHFRVLESRRLPDGFFRRIGMGNVVPSRCGGFSGLRPRRGAVKPPARSR
jgi:hypothetical protein